MGGFSYISSSKDFLLTNQILFNFFYVYWQQSNKLAFNTSHHTLPSSSSSWHVKKKYFFHVHINSDKSFCYCVYWYVKFEFLIALILWIKSARKNETHIKKSILSIVSEFMAIKIHLLRRKRHEMRVSKYRTDIEYFFLVLLIWLVIVCAFNLSFAHTPDILFHASHHTTAQSFFMSPSLTTHTHTALL